jgi:hypothetical protein
MTDDAFSHWLTYAREIQAISRIGLTYSQTRFDTERYTRLSALAAEIIESQTGLPAGPTLENFLVQPGYAYDGNRTGAPLSFYHAYKLLFLLGGTSPRTRNAPPFAEKRRPMRFSPDRRQPL